MNELSSIELQAVSKFLHMTHGLQAERPLPNFPSKLNPYLLKLIALQANLQRGMIDSQLKATGKGANINFTRRGGVL